MQFDTLLLDLVELWCGWDSKQALLEGWRMRNKFFTSVPFVERERWQHSGKSMICSLLPSNHFELNFRLHIHRSCALQKAPHSAHSISNTIQTKPIFHFSIFCLHTFFFFHSFCHPQPSCQFHASHFSLIHQCRLFFQHLASSTIDQRHPNHFPAFHLFPLFLA